MTSFFVVSISILENLVNQMAPRRTGILVETVLNSPPKKVRHTKQDQETSWASGNTHQTKNFGIIAFPLYFRIAIHFVLALNPERVSKKHYSTLWIHQEGGSLFLIIEKVSQEMNWFEDSFEQYLLQKSRTKGQDSKNNRQPPDTNNQSGQTRCQWTSMGSIVCFETLLSSF